VEGRTTPRVVEGRSAGVAPIAVPVRQTIQAGRQQGERPNRRPTAARPDRPRDNESGTGRPSPTSPRPQSPPATMPSRDPEGLSQVLQPDASGRYSAGERAFFAYETVELGLMTAAAASSRDWVQRPALQLLPLQSLDQQRALSESGGLGQRQLSQVVTRPIG
jgi:hypothetical protein